MKVNLSLFILSVILVSACRSEEETGQYVSDKNIYWGDLHNHCNVGYARGSLERSYDIARNHLDFFCFTPHTQWHDQPERSPFDDIGFREAFSRVKEKDWERVVKYANDYYKPGEFVSFIGYEWHSSYFGDSHIIFPGSEGELAYPADMNELKLFARANNAILIPHHPAYADWRGQNWDYLSGTDITPVVEVFSTHGNAERDRSPSPYRRHSMGGRYTRNTLQHLWSTGSQVGIVAGTDSHLGHPGAYGKGLTAVLADTLTRESVMEAIRARRTYGVSADRIELDFRLNGHYMGESIPFTGSRNIYVRVKGKDEIDRVEILRNNKVIYRDFPVDRTNDDTGWDNPVLCRIEYGWGPWSWLGEPRIADWNFDVNVKNGQILSATPCFQSGPFDEDRRNRITFADSANCRFQSHTSRKDAFEDYATNSIILEIQGTPKTELLLSLTEPSGIDHNITLGELAESNDIFFTGEVTSESVLIHRLVFSDNYTAEIEINDKAETGDTDWYYVRVIQSNGSLAWSSPIWVNKQ